ncbi:hypothetical protein KCU85_g43, partial [Aureobasidium melanogenum]
MSEVPFKEGTATVPLKASGPSTTPTLLPAPKRAKALSLFTTGAGADFDGTFVAYQVDFAFPAAARDQEHLRKYVVRGDVVKGTETVVAFGGGEVKRKMRMRLELFEGVTRPYDDLRVEANGYQGSLVGAKCGVGRRIGIEVIDAHNLVIGARGQVFAISREAHRVDGARVVAHSGQLFGLGVLCVGAIADRVR